MSRDKSTVLRDGGLAGFELFVSEPLADHQAQQKGLSDLAYRSEEAVPCQGVNVCQVRQCHFLFGDALSFSQVVRLSRQNPKRSYAEPSRSTRLQAEAGCGANANSR